MRLGVCGIASPSGMWSCGGVEPSNAMPDKLVALGPDDRPGMTDSGRAVQVWRPTALLVGVARSALMVAAGRDGAACWKLARSP